MSSICGDVNDCSSRLWNYDRRPSLAEKSWKNSHLVTSLSMTWTHRALKSLTIPIMLLHEYRHSTVADINLKIG